MCSPYGEATASAAAEDEKIKRFIYAASSSTYGDSTILPKKEDIIGKPLSPYAVTKYVNEIYAHVYGLTYNIDCIGLRYFNVFGPNQSPDGAYAAVIPKFINLLLNGEAPVINGNGKNSRDFTFIENIIQMNHLAATTTNQNAIGQVFNTAYGAQTSLIELVDIIAESLSKYFPEVSLIQPIFGPIREGDIPHSKACIQKAKEMFDTFDVDNENHSAIIILYDKGKQRFKMVTVNTSAGHAILMLANAHESIVQSIESELDPDRTLN